MSALETPPSSPPAPTTASTKPTAWKIFLVGLVIVLAGMAAYSNSFTAPFIFDDQPTILENPSIQKLWPLQDVLWPQHETVSGAMGRPMENFSLAVNYALGGYDVRGYHALNLLIHLLAGLALFGVMRLTLRQPSLRAQFGEVALPLAGMIALLWTVHPLLTETVICVAQRNESLMAFFYLLTLYCFIRGVNSTRPKWWQAGALLACFLGMASKEAMVTAPLLILLYDRTFIAKSFREAWKRRGKLYLGLASTWVFLVLVILKTNQRGHTVGFSLGVAWWSYALKQSEVIVNYLLLSCWPHPLVIDYGNGVVTHPLTVAPQLAVLVVLLAGTIFALWRRSALGFAGASFFMLLAPSSSILPLATQTMAEHRMYLPLAAVISLGVLSFYTLCGRRAFSSLLLLAVVFSIITFQRNENYRSELSIWQSTESERPDNALAHQAYGMALLDAHRLPESVRELVVTLQLDPQYHFGEYNLGKALAAMGNHEQAVLCFSKAIAEEPNKDAQALAYYNLGVSLETLNRLEEALPAAQQATQLLSGYAPAYNSLGIIYSHLGRFDEAVAAYQQALKLQPGFSVYEKNLGAAFMRTGQPAQALPYYLLAAKNAPRDPEAFWCVGNAYSLMDQYALAIPSYRKAIQLQPDYTEAHVNLGTALVHLGRAAEAGAEFKTALHLNPDSEPARAGLAEAQQMQAMPKTGPATL